MGQRKVSELKFAIEDDLRLLSVVCDDDLYPVAGYVLRLKVKDDAITRDSVIAACFLTFVTSATMRTASLSSLFQQPFMRFQFEGWPEDLYQQLAVGLDVTPSELARGRWCVGLRYFERTKHGRERAEF